MYKKELVECGTDYVKIYGEDLNAAPIFMLYLLSYLVNHLIHSCGLVCSRYELRLPIIDVHLNLQSNLNEQSTALLYAILLTLNQSATPGKKRCSQAGS